MNNNTVFQVIKHLLREMCNVNHNILLRRLVHTYQLGGVVFEWFRSYLVGRRQHVQTSCSSSTPAVIACGVPQGSVLGPILFLLYTAVLVTYLLTYLDMPFQCVGLTGFVCVAFEDN